jgi:hypothetical protein
MTYLIIDSYLLEFSLRSENAKEAPFLPDAVPPDFEKEEQIKDAQAV